MGGRAAKTRAALDALDPAQRLAMEGHRPGAYLRLRFSGQLQTPVDSGRQAEALASCGVVPLLSSYTPCTPQRAGLCRLFLPTTSYWAAGMSLVNKLCCAPPQCLGVCST